MTGPFRVESNSWGEGAWLVNGPGFSVSVEPQGDDAEAFAEAEGAARALCGVLNAAPADEPLDATLRRLAEGKWA